MNDVLGQALHDYYYKNQPEQLWIHNRYGPKEQMPVETYFRDEEDMPDLEWVALNECRGKVLDVGAGAGSHALELQHRGYDVTALEISPLAAGIMHNRGVKQIVVQDIFNYQDARFDTILMLMNGIGLAANLNRLDSLLRHLKSLLCDGGQLLFDSSDIAYLYEGKLPETSYYGAISYEYEYKANRSGWFEWLYIDEQTMVQTANKGGWDAEVLYEDEFKQYLIRLTPQKKVFYN